MTRNRIVGGDADPPTDPSHAPVPAERPAQHVSISGSSVVNVIGNHHAAPPTDTAPPDLATRRQTFFFTFLEQALGQAETTFRLSVAFLSAGAAVVLAGGSLALANAGNPDGGYLPVLTSLSGLLITSCGGAFAVHSNRARNHLTQQAEHIHANMQDDLTLAQAMSLIDHVQDADLRDRLKSVTALRVLGLSPDPGEVTSRLLPARRAVGRDTGDPPP